MGALIDVIRKGWARLFLLQFRFLSKKRVIPLNTDFGFNRGTPIGRYFIDEFIARYEEKVQGSCLEFGDDRYGSAFPHVTRYEIFSVKPGPKVTLLGNIHNPSDSLYGAFDWIVCTQFRTSCETS